VNGRTHEELQELLGAYALDAVDGEEYQAVELHLRECPQCRAEVSEHREVAALIGHRGAPAPEGVWDRIVEAMEPAPPRMRVVVDEQGRSAVAPFAPPRQAPRAASRRTPARVMLASLAAAAVIVAGLVGVVVVRLNQRIESFEQDAATTDLVEVAERAWKDPRSRTTELRSPDGSLTAPVALTVSGEGYLRASRLPQLPVTRSYQLWGVVGSQTISLGTFDGGDPVVAFRVHRSVKTVMVTEERAGGVSVSRSAPVLTGSL